MIFFLFKEQIGDFQLKKFFPTTETVIFEIFTLKLFYIFTPYEQLK